ncbi:MAG: hypothetical protein E3K32_11610 [wastewater metagenome]|nr:hypothetical protein [Candidatus Loosdrechtia aerotolerans]
MDEMYATLKSAFQQAEGNGLRLILLIQLGGFSAGHWEKIAATNSNIKMNFIQTREGNQTKRYGAPSIAPEPNGIDKSFEDLLVKIRDAHQHSGVSYPLEYLHIGHDEPSNHRVCIFGKQWANFFIWGVTKSGIPYATEAASITDIHHINGLRRSGLTTSQAYQQTYVGEIFRRLEQTQRILGDHVQLMIYGDAWDPQSHGWLTFETNAGDAQWCDGILMLSGLTDDQKIHFKNGVILLPWNYDGRRPFALPEEYARFNAPGIFQKDIRPDYRTDDTFYKLTKNGFRYLWTYANATYHNTNQAWEYRNNSLNHKRNVLGYYAATWHLWNQNYVDGAFSVIKFLRDVNVNDVPSRSFVNRGSERFYDVHLRSHTGHSLKATNGGGSSVVATDFNRSRWETFTLVDLNGGSLQSGDEVWIQTWNNMHYLVAQNGGGNALLADCTLPTYWETFTIHRVDNWFNAVSGTIGSGTRVAFRAYNNRNYIRVLNGGGIGIDVAGTAIGTWEVMTLEYSSLHSLSFETINGCYLVAEGGGGDRQTVNADRTTAGNWETFVVTDLNGGLLESGDQVNIAGWNNTHYVAAERWGERQLNVDRPSPGTWETFRVKLLDANRSIVGGTIHNMANIAIETLEIPPYYVVAEGGGGARPALAVPLSATGKYSKSTTDIWGVPILFTFR